MSARTASLEQALVPENRRGRCWFLDAALTGCPTATSFLATLFTLVLSTVSARTAATPAMQGDSIVTTNQAIDRLDTTNHVDGHPRYDRPRPVTTEDIAAWLERADNYRLGKSGEVDVIGAYALYLQASRHGSTQAQEQLQQLKKTMTSQEIRVGSIRCGTCRRAQRETLRLRNPPPAKSLLKLRGIVWQGPERIALINGRSFVEGDYSHVKTGMRRYRLTVKCLAIKPNLVRVEVEGEEIELRLPPASSE